MTDTAIAQRRAALRRTGLDADALPDSPLDLFSVWHDDWRATAPHDPAAAVLATTDDRHRPSARWIDLAHVDHGFVLFTAYTSRKSTDLAVHPHAELCFGWLELARQVRVGGVVERLSPLESDDRFASLPRPVQVLAWSTDQRSPLAGRGSVHQRLTEVAGRFEGQEVPRPEFWGGLRLVPDSVEFWQGRSDEVHDRVLYRRPGAGAPWTTEWMSP